MTLRNAFQELATEGTLRLLLRAVNFAKDEQERMKVIVSNTANVIVNSSNSTSSMQGAISSPTVWTQHAWNATDARFEYGEALNSNAIMTKNRWVAS